MLTFEDCVGFCDLSPEEIAAIAEHERVSQLVALELGTCLMKTGPGRARIRGFIEGDIVAARRRADEGSGALYGPLREAGPAPAFRRSGALRPGGGR